MDFVAQITNHGHLSGKDRLKLDDTIRGLAGKRVRITVKPYQKRRSSNQNHFYFGCVVPLITKMLRDYGNNVDDELTHLYLKMRVGKLGQVVALPDGRVEKGLGSTKNLTTTEFEEYLERIRAWAAPLGVVVPFPNEDMPDNAAGESAET